MIRSKILSNIVKDLLGPKNGLNEKVDYNPLKQYITGVISPNIALNEYDPDQEAELIPEFIGGGEPIDDNFYGDVSDSFSSLTVLNPKLRPKSFGLSFNIVSDDTPIISICTSWSRYIEEDNKYLRKTKIKVINKIICNKKKTQYYLDEKGEICDKKKAEICLIILIKKKLNINYISIYFINEINPVKENYIFAEEYIYQPQIRVNIEEGVLDSIDRFYHEDKEEQKLNFIYRNKKVLARGHMCSVYWKEIDVESDNENKPKEIPFYWLDGELLNQKERTEYKNPDLRTEFIPSYNIESPAYEWNEKKWGNKPILNPLTLSEKWSKEDLETSLNPFINGYSKWISNLESEANRYNYFDKKEIVESIIEEANDTLNRLKKGINRLIYDYNSRLAFCFANKVIAKQNEWKSQDTFEWRPFQLAFILLSIDSIVDYNSKERNICDLLYVPTGAGKTEAYLALAAFTMSYSRLVNAKNSATLYGAGCDVIMRYTLRLLTIQQYRRALGVVTACEFFRVYGLNENASVGWRPSACENNADFIWGYEPFSIGLWVGGGVTPNRMQNIDFTRKQILGAISLLRREKGEGEPAQIMNCPACNAILSLPEDGVNEIIFIIHLIIKSDVNDIEIKNEFKSNIQIFCPLDVNINIKNIHDHNNDFKTLSLEFTSKRKIPSRELDTIIESSIKEINRDGKRIEIVSVKSSRPGYFLKYIQNSKGVNTPYDFEIYCPNPQCPLHNEKGLWAEGKPSKSSSNSLKLTNKTLKLPPNMVFSRPIDFVKINQLSKKIPIPAFTVDEQLYTKCPSFIVATVDKFARLPYEPRASSIFGNVDYYDQNWGYYREGIPPHSSTSSGAHPLNSTRTRVKIQGLESPRLIIQDELHLIEGPLGSMVGIYETAIDYLSSENQSKPKYISSTATVKGASEQVNSIFVRGLKPFPSSGLEISDKFFINFKKFVDPIKEDKPGRLYFGICAPGWGSLTPVYRLWAIMLQSSYDLTEEYDTQIDPFWTLIGYFNSIRELAGARSMYRQDIPGRIRNMNEKNYRTLPSDRVVELSSRLNSTELPMLLDEMNKEFSGDVSNPETLDAIFTTSMFGTGVDISRLSEMIVHGQPKTTASYIQATGRVGRRKGGLVATLYNGARPRDLSHYEMFCGYHSNIDRFVEPITVAPFSPGTLSRCVGPVIVSILRNMREVTNPWHLPDSANAMNSMLNSREVSIQPDVFNDRRSVQPPLRSPDEDVLVDFINSEIERWYLSAIKNRDLKYVEYRTRTHPVVLGDSAHNYNGIEVVYENAPQSLRDIEETTGFQTR